MNLDYKDIGLRIKRFRMDKGLSQEELANAVLINSRHISNIENGRRYPSLELIVTIANTLDVTSDDLLTGNLNRSSSTAGSEVHRLLLDCNDNEMKMLIRVLQFAKELLTEFGI